MLRSSFLLTVSLCFGMVTQGQVFLSKGEVFDFQPGDVFQSRGHNENVFGVGSPPGYRTDTILSRIEPAGGDTLIYYFKRWTVGYQYYPLPPIVHSFLDTLVIVGLGQPAHQYSLPSPCPPIQDSVGISTEQCGRNTWWQFPVGDSCFETDWWTSWVVQGCGGPYWQAYSAWDQTLGFYNLVYYHKGLEECGSFSQVPNGVDEYTRSRGVSAFPDPTRGPLNIDGDIGGTFEVEDMIGHVLRSVVATRSIDIGDLPNGMYLIRGVQRTGRPFVFRVVKD